MNKGDELATKILYGYFIIKALTDRFCVACCDGKNVKIIYESQGNFYQTDDTLKGLYLYLADEGLRLRNNGSGSAYNVMLWAFT